MAEQHLLYTPLSMTVKVDMQSPRYMKICAALVTAEMPQLQCSNCNDCLICATVSTLSILLQSAILVLCDVFRYLIPFSRPLQKLVLKIRER